MSSSSFNHIAVAIRRIEHLVYIQVLLERMNKEGCKITLFIDKKFLDAESNQRLATFIDQKLQIEKILPIQSDRMFIRISKRILGNLVYLADNGKDIEYFLRNAYRTSMNVFVKPTLWLLENNSKTVAKVASFLIKFIRKTLSNICVFKKEVQDYDFLLVTPGNMLDSVEDSLMFRFRKAGIPCFIMALSLDNLNNKGTTICVPDLYFAWNSFHRELLIKRHKIPMENVLIVGSPYFDLYARNAFESAIRPSSFLSLLKNQNKEIICYLASSANVVENEPAFLRAKLDEWEFSSRNYLLIIKPHPANQAIWNEWNYGGTLLYSEGHTFIERDYLTSVEILKKSLFAFGINTSAFLDCIAIGTPVFALRNHDALHQENASHYIYLISNGIQQYESLKDVKNFPGELHWTSEQLMNVRDKLLPFFGGVTDKIIVEINKHNKTIMP